MSIFKLKPEKTRFITEIKTLDETHKKIIMQFKKRKNTLPRKKYKLSQLEQKLNELEEKKLYSNEDIILKSKLRDEINELKREIYDIENNISEIEYYSKIDELLIDYYKILEQENVYLNEDKLNSNQFVEIKNTDQTVDNINVDPLDILNKLNTNVKKIKRISKRKKKKEIQISSNSIISYFKQQQQQINNQINEKQLKNKIDRAKLLDQYLTLIDTEYLCNKRKEKNYLKTCDYCDNEKTLIQSEGIYVCKFCGEVEMIIIESEKQNYKDSSSPEKPGYPYKRQNHFCEWLSQFQAKESIEIPKETYDQILAELHKNKFYDLKRLTLNYMKQILKKLGFTQYYEHATHIISILSGQQPPTINREVEERLKLMFKQIQEPFEKYKPPKRVNFLSYSYVLHKFCELLELDDFINYFPLLKSRDKLKQQDKIWEKICKDLKWQFIPSI